MALATGTHLGSYEVIAQIGAGGMGEVYEALDTKLGRNVAIKVLPAAFVNDPERLARFQREARMLAALNHPNIATIYGLEQSNGTHFLIMELVSGDTLAERIKREGAVPAEEALKIAVQIAEALEAAHEKGIIHRDLKPANVKVTPEGKVKILDFGLAKAFASDTASSDPSDSPTLSRAATMQGVILGTAAYMSPEQARSKLVDKRTDIWAFGCVLYEMLTGKQVFEGEDITEILAAVVKTEPDWQALPPAMPAQIRTLLKRCLQKDKSLRMQAAGDARIEIQEALSAPLPPASPTGTVSRRTVWRWAVASALACLIVATIVGFAVWNLKPTPAPSTQPVTRTVINLPPGQQLAGLDGGPAVALSPDGTRLAYVANEGFIQQAQGVMRQVALQQRIYLRAMDSLEAKPIPGTEGAVNPFFSPDGQWLGFFAGSKLKKVSVSGGTALTVGDVGMFDPLGASWSSQGAIAFPPTSGSALEQVPNAGGTPQPLTRLEKGDISHRWPEFLPGGKAVLFATGVNSEVAVQSLATGERRNLIQGTGPHYAPSGHLIYAFGGSLMAVPFDLQRLAVMGAPVPVVESVQQSPVSGATQYSFSATGSLVYVPGRSAQPAPNRLVWVSRSGLEQPLNAPAHAYFLPRLSPDGRRVALGFTEQDTQIWLYDLSRETLSRLTFAGNFNFNPAWTPDGKQVAFQSNEEGPINLFWQLADGSGKPERLNTSEYTQGPHSWSPDGQLLAFVEINPTTGLDIWVLRMGDPGTPGQARKAQPFLRTPFNESGPRFSPDGRWLAYVSDESGRFEVYVQPYPGPGGKLPISTDGGDEPVWNPNGRELFYRSGNQMMTVDVTTQPSFAVGKPRVLFMGEYALGSRLPNYDVSRDGQRFLMLKPSEQTSSSAATQIVVVQNWFEELKQKVPTGKK